MVDFQYKILIHLFYALVIQSTSIETRVMHEIINIKVYININFKLGCNYMLSV